MIYKCLPVYVSQGWLQLGNEESAEKLGKLGNLEKVGKLFLNIL